MNNIFMIYLDVRLESVTCSSMTYEVHFYFLKIILCQKTEIESVKDYFHWNVNGYTLFGITLTKNILKVLKL